MSYIATAMNVLFLSTIWIVCAVLARESEALFLPQAVRYLLGAFVLGLAAWAVQRRPPGISVRLLHAALTVGGLCYFIAPVFTFYALRVIPSGMVATLYLSMPFWYLAMAFAARDMTPVDLVMAAAGLILFTIGIWPQSLLRGPAHLPLLCLVVGMLAFIVGGVVARRLFWLHSAIDLGFWAMLLAGTGHLLMGIVCGEHHLAGLWDRAYWGYLLYLAVFVTGAAAFLGRVRRGPADTWSQAVVAPALAFGLGWALWRETPLNVMTAGGFVLVLAPIARTLHATPLGRWMALSLYNERRQGDRLVCQIDAEIAGDKSRIMDIGFDGVGFRTGKQMGLGEIVPVKFPIGRDGGHVWAEGRVVHIESTGSRDFPFSGGMELTRINAEHKQSLVEFLARLARAEER